MTGWRTDGRKGLDVRCGAGYPISKYLCDKGFSVTGIDVSENMIKKAVGMNLPVARFFQCDFFAFQPDEKFDGIIAFDSFFHFPKEKQPDIYGNVAEWMNTGGTLLFTHGKREGEIEDYKGT